MLIFLLNEVNNLIKSEFLKRYIFLDLYLLWFLFGLKFFGNLLFKLFKLLSLDVRLESLLGNLFRLDDFGNLLEIGDFFLGNLELLDWKLELLLEKFSELLFDGNLLRFRFFFFNWEIWFFNWEIRFFNW